ncbi:hypothetical protein FACS189416_6370 [Bacteroidia bacterium]|nr:hypothetical protein FACS189416_6370 [Bacteroidia bacterium]
MKKVIKSCLLLSVLCSMFVFFSCNSNAKQSKDAVIVEDIYVPTGAELIIIAHVNVHQENIEELQPVFQAVVDATRLEEGNISYDLYEDINDPLKYTFIENWKSQAAIDAHNASAHFQKFAQAINGKADLDVHIIKHKF